MLKERINRIRLEFKVNLVDCTLDDIESINRIRLEFKVSAESHSDSLRGVLIESDWNLKESEWPE